MSQITPPASRSVKARRKSMGRGLIVPYFIWFGLFVLGPFTLIALTSFFRRTPLGLVEPAFTLDNFIQLFDPLYFKVLVKTFTLASLNTAFTLALAYPLAFHLSRLRPQTRMWLLAFVLVPFWTNFLIRILAFMDVLRFKPFGIDLIYTNVGVLGAMVYNYLPFAVLPLYAACEKVDNSVIEAARDLGATKRQVFFKVLLPLTWSGVASAAMLVFIPSLGEFVIPELVGGGQTYLLGNFLRDQFLTARNWPLGSAAIVGILMVAALLIFLRPPETEAERR